MFSNESLKHAESCRFCWMCRHICPVGQATGNEAWTPRARGLLVKMVEDGVTEYEPTVADALYMCSLCDSCYNDCETDWKPSIFIREARGEAVARGVAPAGVMTAIDNLMKTGSIDGSAMDASVAAEAAKLPAKAEVLLFLGKGAANKAAATAKAAMSLMAKAGVNYTVLKDEPNSGAYLADLMGYTGDVQEQAKKAAAAIAATGAKKVVALDPMDAQLFTEKYAEWSLLNGVEVVTATAFFAELIAAKKLAPKKAALTAAIHDPARLARGLGETEAVREIAAALGIEVKEMFLNKKLSRDVGTVVLNSYAPNVVKGMTQLRAADAARLNIPAILTVSADDFDLLNQYNDTDVKVVDLFALLDEQC